MCDAWQCCRTIGYIHKVLMLSGLGEKFSTRYQYDMRGEKHTIKSCKNDQDLCEDWAPDAVQWMLMFVSNTHFVCCVNISKWNPTWMCFELQYNDEYEAVKLSFCWLTLDGIYSHKHESRNLNPKQQQEPHQASAAKVNVFEIYTENQVMRF